MRAHLRLHQLGLLRRRPLPLPTVAVGGRRFGGDGKTPVARWLASRVAESHDRCVAVLARGYRSRRCGVAFDSLRPRPPTLEFGDEAAEASVRLAPCRGRILWVVHQDRRQALRIARQRCHVDVVVLDDGLHHHSVLPHLSIAIINGGPYAEPGWTREGSSLRQRADQVWSMNAPAATEVDVGFEVRATSAFDGEQRNLLQLGPSLLVLGVGNPRRVIADVRSAGVGIVGTAIFRDHHRYTRAQAASLSRRATRLGARCVATTGKDWVKLRPLWHDRLLPLARIDADVVIHHGRARVNASVARLTEIVPTAVWT